MVASGSPVPLNVGVVSFVIPSLFDEPVSDESAKSGTLGARAGVVSSVIITAADGKDVLTPSDAVAVRELAPSFSETETDQAVVVVNVEFVAIDEPPVTVTVDPVTPVPLIVICVVLTAIFCL